MAKKARTSTTEAGGQVTLTRVLDAPRELVWRAWTRPEQFARWFGTPPFTTPLSKVSMDVRPGGEWRATQVAEDGTELPFVGVYREIAEPERLVFTFEDPQDRSDPDIEVATLTLAEIDGRTEMTFRQAGHLPEEEYGKLEQGYGLFFDRLAAHLREVSTSSFLIDPDRPVVVMRRTFDAPSRMVFDALTRPDLFEHWYGPHEYAVVSAEADVRPGGAYRIVQRGPDGTLHGFRGEYRDVVPGERIVQTWAYEGVPDSVAIITSVLEERDGMTTLTETTEFPNLADRADNLAAGGERGALESWTRLAALVESMR
jgi:uncharacterized protein YndB with AHSA1/START domain